MGAETATQDSSRVVAKSCMGKRQRKHLKLRFAMDEGRLPKVKKVAKEEDGGQPHVQGRQQDLVEEQNGHGFLPALPQQIVRNILENYVASQKDLVNLRSVDRAARQMCTQIFAEKALLEQTSQAESTKFALPWCKDLEELELCDVELSDMELCNVASKCQKLKKFTALKCTKVTAHGLRMFFSLTRGLEELHLEHCDQLFASTLTCLVEKCPKLRKLSFAHCPNLDSTGLHVLARYAALEEVELRQCVDVRNDSIYALLTSSHSNIRRLSLQDCSQLDDTTLRWVAHLCPALEYLNISGLDRVSDKGFAAVSKGCSHLRHIEARGCSSIRSAGVAVALQLCKNLCHLDVSGTKVADICFLSVRPVVPNLVFLGLKNCSELSRKGLAEAKKKYPSTQIFASGLSERRNSTLSCSTGEASPGCESSSSATMSWTETDVVPSQTMSKISSEVSTPTKTPPSRTLVSLVHAAPFMLKVHSRGAKTRHNRLSTRAMLMQQMIANTHNAQQSDSEASESLV
mmetsp:Transcript_19972/g.39223  ORF Transcript_19972/g.39223 Transcript_19972/m.39223 type:complete len:516 (-) Transcript_19972:377-1924(-)